MSVTPFPAHPGVASERLRAIRAAVALRAKSSGATLAQRFEALRAAVLAWERGETAGICIQAGYDQLPSVRGKR